MNKRQQDILEPLCKMYTNEQLNNLVATYSRTNVDSVGGWVWKGVVRVCKSIDKRRRRK